MYLQPDDHADWGAGYHEVLRVTECSALVRPMAREPVTITDEDGNERTFYGRGRAFHISPSAAGMRSVIRAGKEIKS